MEIMEIALQLGKAIQKSALYEKFKTDKIEYENNERLIEYLKEYQADQKALESAGEMQDVDTHLVDTLKERIEELYGLITENPIYTNYVESQNALNALMEQVNQQITFAITGSMPCDHDCSGCSGCSHD